MDIKFVYFDLGRVLLDFSHELACQQMAEVAGVSSETIRETVFRSDLQLQYEAGQVSTDEFFERCCDQLGSRPDYEKFVAAASEIFCLNTGVMPLVTTLASTYFPRGILSNTCDAHWHEVKTRFPTLLELLPVHALSFELKCLKPEPEIYTKAAELAAVAPQQIYFVDDRPENVEGAREAGFISDVYESPQQLHAAFRSRGFAV